MKILLRLPAIEYVDHPTPPLGADTMPDSLVLRQSPEGYLISSAAYTPSTKTRAAKRRRRPSRAPRLPCTLNLEENPETPALLAKDPEIETRPVQIPKRCACGCHISTSGRPWMVAISVDVNGLIKGGLGFLSSDGCAELLIRRRQSEGLMTAILHPNKAQSLWRGMCAQPIVEASASGVRPKWAYRYRIA